MSQAEYRRPREVRFRLFNPPNPVPDRGITMRNGWPVLPPKRPTPRIPEIIFHQRCLDFFNACMPQCPTESEVPQHAPFHPAPPKVEVRKLGRAFLAQSVFEYVAKSYFISVNDLLSMRRDANAVRARQIAMWLIKELTSMTLPWIGRRMAGRDHTTVLHGIRKIEELRKTDPDLQEQLDQFLSALRPITENSNANTTDFRD